jgi:hypothetical protein
MKVVIVGGGWAGCSAAIIARKLGAEVILIERTDMLLGTGLVGGIMRNNGRFTATEEMIAMGTNDLFELIDNNSPYKNINFPGHQNASIYDTTKIEGKIRSFLTYNEIQIHDKSRFFDLKLANNKVEHIFVKYEKMSITVDGDVFIDTTGSGGPTAVCNKYGNGCAICVLRCPAFGGRISITEKVGINETVLRTGKAIGGMSGSCKLVKESLSKDIIDQLKKEGIAIIPIPKRLKNNLYISNLLKAKACQQYAIPAFKENIILLNTGMAKMMIPYFPLEELRQITGFENVRYEDPYAGSIGNSVRYTSAPLRDNTLKVEGIENLFCAGEKAGACVGHTEAICTGSLAGYNAVQCCKNNNYLTLPN